MSRLSTAFLTGCPNFNVWSLFFSYYEGLSAPKIAEILETTPGAVTQLLHRGRNALKTKLVELGIEGWIDDKNNG
ncbi:MAG: sigma-70 family RNA polymerase sigma factor [Methylocystaceae bacterium]|nr:sigma-70 family RNA polymerase sigma factor [Methylocystaceae bacterium]